VVDRYSELVLHLVSRRVVAPRCLEGEGFVYAGSMDINRMLLDLRTERVQIEEAIAVLERLSLGQGKRRGRPPKWMTQVKRRGRPKGSKNKPKE
jgi:hypothetical protein